MFAGEEMFGESFWDDRDAGLVIKLQCQQDEGLFLNLKDINTASQLADINVKVVHTKHTCMLTHTHTRSHRMRKRINEKKEP